MPPVAAACVLAVLSQSIFEEQVDWLASNGEITARSASFFAQYIAANPHRRDVVLAGVLMSDRVEPATARPIILPLLFDEDTEVRSLAVRLVPYICPNAVLASVLFHLMHFDPTSWVASDAAIALYCRGMETQLSKAILIGRLRATIIDGEAYGYIGALSRCNNIPPSAVEPLGRWLEQGNRGWHVQDQVLRALVKVGPPAASLLPRLRELQQADDPTVRSLAKNAILAVSRPN